jgi:hypothetical protein
MEVFLVYHTWNNYTTIHYNGTDSLKAIRIAKEWKANTFDVKVQVWVDGELNREIEVSK